MDLIFYWRSNKQVKKYIYNFRVVTIFIKQIKAEQGDTE